LANLPWPVRLLQGETRACRSRTTSQRGCARAQMGPQPEDPPREVWLRPSRAEAYLTSALSQTSRRRATAKHREIREQQPRTNTFRGLLFRVVRVVGGSQSPSQSPLQSHPRNQRNPRSTRQPGAPPLGWVGTKPRRNRRVRRCGNGNNRSARRSDPKRPGIKPATGAAASRRDASFRMADDAHGAGCECPGPLRLSDGN
jgi:hypothetical protein